jgi:hypothetical protein
VQKRLGRTRNGNPVIVTTHYRYKPPPRKRKTTPLVGPAVVTTRPTPPVEDEPEPTAPPPANDDSPTEPTPRPAAQKKPAIAPTTGRKRRISDSPPLPMELPLSRKPVERDGDDYKRLKAALARRLRGETN